MTPQQEELVRRVDAASGSIGWNDLLEDMSHNDQQKAMGNIRELERLGVLQRNLVRDGDTGQVIFTIDKVA